MDRKFLEEKGLDEEAIDEIIAEHEKLMDELRVELEAKISEKEEEMEELRRDFDIDRELTGLGARNHKAVKALLDKEALRTGDPEELVKQLEKIRRENGYLFAGSNTPVATGPTAPRTEKSFGFKFTGVR